VFDHNSFEQLCVNYTNEKIHQIYLEQVFIHEKSTLKKEGLESVISRLTFTDNIKIIELIDSLNKSIFNLLDESCSVNVKDDDFLANVRKHHDQHEHFPPSNLVNLRKSFIIKHTPGDIEYMADGFRDKNKDLIR
jgi:myosin-7